MGSERGKLSPIHGRGGGGNSSQDQSEPREIPGRHSVNIKRAGVIPEAQYGDHFKNCMVAEKTAQCLTHPRQEPDNPGAGPQNPLEASHSGASVCNPSTLHQETGGGDQRRAGSSQGSRLQTEQERPCLKVEGEDQH